ncbi:hypothetical protein X737_03000 [Mesorhizobium sp. L48C026A00]|nr:hypothetical protein X737_03000 [Mesorhizobium sp. L48C026A00]
MNWAGSDVRVFDRADVEVGDQTASAGGVAHAAKLVL